ncbi:MAG TPA: IS4 family transposase [Acidimicrobiia bacterium]|nr:IS4 family transposase [Acidimicrobiia bacterium]
MATTHTTPPTQATPATPATPLTDKDIVCLGHLKRAFGLLGPLRDVGCGRDRAGNRELFFDDYVKLVLLYVWNPLIGSVRDLQQAVGLPAVAKALGVRRFSAGSFSESVRVFDPDRLKPVIAELAGQLAPYARDPRLADLDHVLTLVDGTVLPALARLARAACPGTRYNTGRDGTGMYAWRLHTQFELDAFRPGRVDRTGARNAGESRENNVLRRALEAGRCYVADGGYADRSLFDDIVDAGSSYVIRGAGNSVFAVVDERLLSQAALDAGVVRDAVVVLGGAGAEPARHRVRRVEVQVEPHPRRIRAGRKQTDLLILYTNLLDLPAELVALIYRYRYTVELFFRVFKQLLGMRHLLSQREEGIDIQIYCAVIVCLLIQLVSGKKPTKAMRNLVGWYLVGLADERDVVAFLNQPDHAGVKKRAKEALWKKLGY